jgi:hypothetical protein
MWYCVTFAIFSVVPQYQTYAANTVYYCDVVRMIGDCGA